MQNFITEAIRKAMGVEKGKETTMSAVPSGRVMVENTPLSHMYNNRWNRATLEYPYDIQQRSDLGHYMMFFVNVPYDTSYPGGKGKSATAGKDDYQYGVGRAAAFNTRKFWTTEDTIQRSASAFSLKGGNGVSADLFVDHERNNSTKFDRKNRALYQGQALKSANSTRGGPMAGPKKKRMTRTRDAIVLYMPPNISTTYGAGWKDVEYGLVGGSAAAMTLIGGADAALDRMKGNKSNAIMNQMASGLKAAASEGGGLSDTMEEFTARKIGGSLGGMAGAGEAFTALDKMQNRALNNYVEAVFTGIGYRKFSYTWKFTPRDPNEAEMVDTIIRTFKFHMLPEYQKASSGRYFTVPSEFELYYMYRGDENTWMNKLKTSVLTNMEVNYTPNTNWQTLRPTFGRNGAPPAEIDMKLDFQETDLVTKEDIMEGF